MHVTGTFDDWGKSEQLIQKGDIWEKEVNLSNADEKIYYKFVVDDKWVIDPTAPQEDDGHFNINNVLLPKDIKKHAGTYSREHQHRSILTAAVAGKTDTTTAAGATTASEPEAKRHTPGDFPETPAEEPEKPFGVAPIAASSGIGNPVSLAPGEKVPTLTDRTVDSTATTSKEGYERDASAALPAAAGLAGAGGLAALAGSAFSKPEEKQNLIPESSLPMGGETKNTMDSGPHIQSAAPDSSTAGLAAGVPLEKKRQAMIIDPADAPQTGAEIAAAVPEPVKESIAESRQSPEAAASSEAVKEKSAVEQELLKKTTTSEATGDSGVTPATQTSYYGLATEVPPAVEKSMQAAHAAPEAATDSSAVAEKSAMEQELLKKIPSSEEAGEPAPTIAAATSETAPSATTGEKVAAGVVGGAAAAGGAAALASGKTFGGDGAFHTDPVGDVSKEEEIMKPETVEHFKNDPTSPVSFTAAGALATGAAGAAAVGAGAIGTLGSKSSAPAAVADGADGADIPSVGKSSVPLEKTEGDVAEYAPVPATKTEPGVSAAAAAAVSDGTEDPTLADEPAVKMMQQDEGKTAGGTVATTEGVASAYDAVTSNKAAAAPTSAAATAGTKDGEMFAPHQGTASAYDAATGDKAASPTSAKPTPAAKSSTMGPSGTGSMRASSTPVKKAAAADNSTSSPTSSANTKETKKRNRLSRLFHKIVD